MSTDLILKPSCSGCGSSSELYGSTCKHLTLCVSCGKTMAQNHGTCNKCGAPITRLIREYNVRACSTNDKNYFIGRFATGLPNFSKKKNENKWSLQKEGLQGRQVTDTLREKYKNKPWLLEDETGQSQYLGQLEGAQSATYYLLMLQGREFVAIPAGSWYNFNKVAQYKQLTLEEAEEKMKNRRKTADGYQRWMMKAANNGAAAFGEVERPDDKESGGGGGKARKKSGDDDEGNASDHGEEDEEEESARKSRLGLNKRGGDDDEEGPRGGDLDLDDDDIEKGDDWEHEEIFTDDDEAVGNDPEEREDLAPEIPAPPEIKQDDEDEDEADEEGGGLSKSGKELKKLLGKANGMNESDAEDDDEDEEEEDLSSPVLAPKLKDTPKEEPVETSSPAKPPASGSNRATPSTSKSSKAKRKANGDEPKSANGAPSKKVKTETETKSVKEEVPSAAKNSASKGASSSSSSSAKTASTPSTGPVTEDEIRAVLLQKKPVTTQDLVNQFKSRLKSREDKNTFAAVLRRISKIQKTNTASYVVLRERANQ